MSRYKLSLMDIPQQNQFTYNDEAKTHDVSIANDLTPPRYDEVEYTYKDATYGKELEFVTFYGNGEREVYSVEVPEFPTGKIQSDSFSFLGQDTAILDGRYVILNDKNGSVGAWFNVDLVSTPPVTGATRDIEINLTSGDSGSAIATKFNSAVDADSEFTGDNSVPFFSIISNISAGNIGQPNNGTTVIEITNIMTGLDSLNGLVFRNLIRPDVTVYVWFNIDGGATDPAYADETGIEVILLSSDSRVSVLSKLSDAMNDHFLMDTTNDIVNYQIQVTNKYLGTNGGIEDVDSGLTFKTVRSGVPVEMVGQVQVKYDGYFITNLVRIL